MHFAFHILLCCNLLLSLQAGLFSIIKLNKFNEQTAILELAAKQDPEIIAIKSTFIGTTIELSYDDQFGHGHFNSLNTNLYYTINHHLKLYLFTINGLTLEVTSAKFNKIVKAMPREREIHFHLVGLENYWITRKVTYEKCGKICPKFHRIIFNWNNIKTIPEIIKSSNETVFSKARTYEDVNTNLPAEYWKNYKHVFKWESQSGFEIGRKLGFGRYSEVFQCIRLIDNTTCAIKVLNLLAISKIDREIKILRNLADGPNIIKLMSVVRDEVTKTPALVMEYVETKDFNLLNQNLSDYEIRFYMFELLKALDYSHSMGIMHRDIKPSNIAIDLATKKLRLLDFGISSFYHPTQKYTIGVSSPYYKAPELLLGYSHYNYALDMWSFGALFAGVVFHKAHFFFYNGDDKFHELVRISKFLGTHKLFEYANKYKLQLDPRFYNIYYKYYSTKWEDLINVNNTKYVTSEVIDLVDKLLRYDHEERLTAREAMEHPYFSQIVAEQGLPPVNLASVVVAKQMTLAKQKLLH